MSLRFRKFLQDPAEYSAAEKYWESLFARILNERGVGPRWVRWFTPKFVSGDLSRDGNPIFNRICRKRKKAIRVIQLDPAQFEENKLAVWMDTGGTDDELSELVICCVLTDEAENVASALFRAFVVFDRSVAEMKRLISVLHVETDA